MENKKYIILELIPDAISPDKGNIIQLSALKLKGLKLISRFDYRLNYDKINNIDLRTMISYDKYSFKYVDDGKIILEKFKRWAKDLDLLIIDNEYTYNFLKDIDNKKESIFNYLGLEFSDDVIDKVISKYNLEPSNYIVDLLYEALIYESNNKKK
jgi:hypothetical protein